MLVRTDHKNDFQDRFGLVQENFGLDQEIFGLDQETHLSSFKKNVVNVSPKKKKSQNFSWVQAKAYRVE